MLTLKTNIGILTYPIVVRIPHSVAAVCYKSVQRPPWELRTYCLCLCSLAVFVVLILTAAVYDARRLFDDVNKHRLVRVSFSHARFTSVFGTSPMARHSTNGREQNLRSERSFDGRARRTENSVGICASIDISLFECRRQPENESNRTKQRKQHRNEK
jgi:hypothetical protein